MKLIWRIAKTELQLLFLSPIAWILLIIFTIQAGLAFMNIYEESVRTLVLDEKLYSVTAQLFGQDSGVFATIQGKLYLYLPLLTMGLISREQSNGTIKLLYSSPITSEQIIFGKFLSMVVYGLTLIAVLLIFITFSAFTVDHFDLPMILSGLLGIFLLYCSYAAIGLFVSCLISYQVAVAVCTMAIFAALQYIGLTGQDIPLFRDITYWLSISGRTGEFIKGLIASEDLLYFIIIISLFLILAIIKLKSDKQSKARLSTAIKYTTALLVAVFLGYVTSRPRLKVFADTTATKSMTLAIESQNIVRKLKGGLKITTYVNLMDPQYSMRFAEPKKVLQDMDQLKQYVRFKPETQLTYKFYYDEDSSQSHNSIPLKKRAETAAEAYRVNFNLFESPSQIRKEINLSSEDYSMTRVIEREDGKSTVLNVYNDPEVLPTEREISAALNTLTGDAPIVGFLQIPGSRDLKSTLKKGYKYLSIQTDYRFSLANQGYRISYLPWDQKIPSDIDILVLADPGVPLPEKIQDNIMTYINGGGNLLIAGDVGDQLLLNPLISVLGVQLLPGTLVQQSENERPNLILGKFSGNSFRTFPEMHNYAGGVVSMPGAVGLTFDRLHGFNIQQILSSRKFGSWLKAKPLSPLDDTVNFNPQEGDMAGIFPIAITMSRKLHGKEQRIFVSGDADFMSNAELQGGRVGIPAVNVPFSSAIFSWLSANKLPLKITRPIPKDQTINFAYENLGLMDWLFFLIIPGIMLITGGVIIYYRKNT